MRVAPPEQESDRQDRRLVSIMCSCSATASNDPQRFLGSWQTGPSCGVPSNW